MTGSFPHQDDLNGDLPRGTLLVPIPFTQLQPGTLWLPGRSTPVTRRAAFRYIMVSLGYSDLFGGQPTWDDIAQRLQRYSLWQVLDVVGRASAVLNKLEPWQTFEGQELVCHGLFGDRCAEILGARQRWLEQRQEDERPGRFILFHELQLINAVKIALLVLPPEDTAQREQTFDALGEALLMMNDLIGHADEVDLEAVDPNTPDGRRRWHQYLLVNGLFHSGDNPEHALARAYELYLTDRPHLQDCGSYLDLPALVREATDLSPELLWTSLFSLNAHWKNLDPKQVQNAPGAINLNDYFTAKCNFSKEESGRFFSLVAEEARAVREQLIAAGFGPKSLRPFDILPFEDKPLIVVGENVYCVSVRLLLRKITRGLHYLFLNGIEDAGTRQLYLTYMGEVFGDYVDALFKRAFPPLSNRYLDAKTLQSMCPERTKVCDGLLIYPDQVILLEFKATLFTAAVRASGDWADYERKIVDIFVDAAEQIEATIGHIEGGRFKELGVDPDRVLSYLPIVIALEELPMMRPVYDHIEEELNARGLLRRHKTKSLQAIDVSDLEFLEVAVDQGRDIAQLLDEKVSSDEHRDTPLGNYCIQRDEPFIRAVNPYLAKRFEELGDLAVEVVRSRSREG